MGSIAPILQVRRLRPLECQEPAQGHTTASRKPGAGMQLCLTSKPLPQCHSAFPRGGLPWGFPVTTHTGEGRPQTTQHSLRPSLPFSASCADSGAQWRQAPCPTPGSDSVEKASVCRPQGNETFTSWLHFTKILPVMGLGTHPVSIC